MEGTDVVAGLQQGLFQIAANQLLRRIQLFRRHAQGGKLRMVELRFQGEQGVVPFFLDPAQNRADAFCDRTAV